MAFILLHSEDYTDSEQLSFFVYRLITKWVLLGAKENNHTFFSFFIHVFSACVTEYILEAVTPEVTNTNTC